MIRKTKSLSIKIMPNSNWRKSIKWNFVNTFYKWHFGKLHEKVVIIKSLQPPTHFYFGISSTILFQRDRYVKSLALLVISLSFTKSLYTDARTFARSDHWKIKENWIYTVNRSMIGLMNLFWFEKNIVSEEKDLLNFEERERKKFSPHTKLMIDDR